MKIEYVTDTKLAKVGFRKVRRTRGAAARGEVIYRNADRDEVVVRRSGAMLYVRLDSGELSWGRSTTVDAVVAAYKRIERRVAADLS